MQNHIPLISASLETAEGRRLLAEAIHRQFEIYYGSDSSCVEYYVNLLQAIIDGDTRLARMFGGDCYPLSVALIWPRRANLSGVGELRCRVFGCSSWTTFDLPEILFLPNLVIGKGGNVCDGWRVEWGGGPPYALCPAHRHRWIPRL